MSATEPAAKGCAACGRPLNVLREHGRTVYRHPLPPADGHHAQPVPLGYIADPAWVCDFCSAPDPRWSYEFDGLAVVTLTTGDTAVDANNLGRRWAACDRCAALIDNGDQPALTRRSVRTLLRDHGVRDPRINAQLTLLHRRLLDGRRPTRQPLRAGPARTGPADGGAGRQLPPTLMPKIRDRLADYWRHQAPLELAAAMAAGLALNVPAHLVDTEQAAVRPDATDPAGLTAYLALMAHHVDQAPLYWIDPEYTTLAIHAGAGLADLTVAAHDLPTTHGLLIWATPVSHHDIPTVHQELPIVAAHWGPTPDGVWVVFYTQTDLLHATGRATQLQQLRERVGWLAPAYTGLGLHHNRTVDRSGDDRTALAALIATWLLAAQPDTDTVTAPADKATRRAYARAGRADPAIRVLRLRPKPQAQPAEPDVAGDHRGRTYRHRWWVNGFWREQPYGPGRSLRRRTFVRGHMKGPDGAPLLLRHTIHVLGDPPRPQ